MTAATPARSHGDGNPYVGPRAFQYGERIYGRNREVLDLLDLLIAERITLLHSPSGAGKTSLVQAGLVPRLEREGLPTVEEILSDTERTHARVRSWVCESDRMGEATGCASPDGIPVVPQRDVAGSSGSGERTYGPGRS